MRVGVPKIRLNELTERMSDETGFAEIDCDTMARSVLSQIIYALEVGEDISITGFGVFKAKWTPAKWGRNPYTGVPMRVKACRRIYFKPAKSFREIINGKR